MSISRRDFLSRSTLALALGAAATGCRADDGPPALRGRETILRNAQDWAEVRSQFALSPDVIHLSALYIASHPKPVRDAIEFYRRALDSDPVVFLNEQNRNRINDVLAAAAAYLGVSEPDDIALTDSTTMGLGLVYNGLQLADGDEVLTTTRDYFVTHESLRLAALRKNITVRRVSLYDEISEVTEDSLTDAVVRAITAKTRVLALTWVHSGTGLKLPIGRICQAVKAVNAQRDEAERILVCVDAVHGFGVEDVTMSDLGCDFFISGCHKWLFGPRGTGLIWGSPRGWERVLPSIPSFLDNGLHDAWTSGTEVTGRTDGLRMSPGGFKPFEHQWAIAEAFAFHGEIGKSRVAKRTHALARQLKEGMREMAHIRLRTPISEQLSSGIVCCEVDGMDAIAAVTRLHERGVIATVTPYAERLVRFAPSIRNAPQEVETALAVIRQLG